MAGTVIVRTKKVSSKIPHRSQIPLDTVPMLENKRPHIEAAKIRPAAVITPLSTQGANDAVAHAVRRLVTHSRDEQHVVVGSTATNTTNASGARSNASADRV